MAEQSKGATIRGFSQEKESGQTYYEAELMVNGHTKDVLVDANGSVVGVEEQVYFFRRRPRAASAFRSYHFVEVVGWRRRAISH